MRKKKIIIILTIIIILIIVGIVGYLYAKTDMFKSDESLFYKYLFKTQLLSSEVTDRYKLVEEKIKSSNYSASGNVNCSVTSNDTSTNVANIQELFSAKYNVLENRSLKQSYADVTVSSNSQDLATVRYLKDDNTYALKMDNVVTKYLAVENSNLRELAQKLGVSDDELTSIPDSIPQMTITEFLNIDETTLNNIKTTYGNIIKEKIQSSNFSKKTNSDKTVTLTLSLSEQQVNDIIKALLENLKNDDTTLNLIIEKAQMLGYELNIDSMKTSIQESIDEITNGTYSQENGFLVLSVTENGTDTVKLDLSITNNDSNDESTMLSDESTTIEENSLSTITTYSIDLSEKNVITIYINDINDNIVKEVLTFGYDATSISLNTKTYNLDENGNETDTLLTIQYQINNYNSDDITQNVAISVNSDNDSKIQVDIDNEIQLKQDINIEKITDENSLLLNDRTSEELTNLFSQIIARLQYLYGDTLDDLASVTVSDAQTTMSETEIAVFNSQFTGFLDKELTQVQATTLEQKVAASNATNTSHTIIYTNGGAGTYTAEYDANGYIKEIKKN